MGRKTRNFGFELLAIAVLLVVLVNRKQIASNSVEVIKMLPWIAIVLGVGYLGVLIAVQLFRWRTKEQMNGNAVSRPTPVSDEGSTSESDSIHDPLRDIDWFQFEKLMELVYSKEGYRVERRGGAHPDGGIDLVLIRGIERIAVQCKHWKSRQAGVKVVREFLGAITAERFDSGVFVISNDVTDDARELAAANNIKLLDRRGLNSLMARHDVAYDPEFTKILNGTDKRCPKCESEMVQRVSKKGANVGERFWGCSTFPKCRFVMQR